MMDKVLIRKKIENLWFYHKWKMVGALFVLAALFVGIKSCVEKPAPDLFVLFAHDKSVNALQTRELDEWFEKQLKAVDEDAWEVTVISTANTDQWTGYNSAAMLTQINNGEGILYLLTDDTYQLLHDNGILQDLAPYVGESRYLDGDRYHLSASGALDTGGFLQDDDQYYLCLRKMEGTTFEGVEKYEDQYELAKKLLKNLKNIEKK